MKQYTIGFIVGVVASLLVYAWLKNKGGGG
jgi:hypothetical protein